jgi:hypothetical protein
MGRVSRSDIGTTPKEVRAFLYKCGIIKPDLDRFGASDRLVAQHLEEEVVSAAHLFATRKLHDFTTSHLHALLYHKNWNPENINATRKRVGHATQNLFGEKAKAKQIATGFPVDSIQILREETGNYKGNLYDVRDLWPGFSASSDDLRKGITLPIPQNDGDGKYLSTHDAFAICAIIAEGYLTATPKGTLTRTVVQGDRFDVEYIRDVLAPIIEATFNLSDTYKGTKYPTRDKKGTYIRPAIDISSQTIATWLHHDIGMPPAKTNNKDKKIPAECLHPKSLIAGLSGIISSKSALSTSTQKKTCRLRVNSRDTNFLKQIKMALGQAQIPTSKVYTETSPHFVEVTSANMPTLFSTLHLKNPKLARAVPYLTSKGKPALPAKIETKDVQITHGYLTCTVFPYMNTSHQATFAGQVHTEFRGGGIGKHYSRVYVPFVWNDLRVVDTPETIWHTDSNTPLAIGNQDTWMRFCDNSLRGTPVRELPVSARYMVPDVSAWVRQEIPSLLKTFNHTAWHTMKTNGSYKLTAEFKSQINTEKPLVLYRIVVPITAETGRTQTSQRRVGATPRGRFGVGYAKSH